MAELENQQSSIMGLFIRARGQRRHDHVLDLMEPLRPIADRRVLEFVQEQTFHPADFAIRSDGVCRLNPELAKRVVEKVNSQGSSEPSTVCIDFGVRFEMPRSIWTCQLSCCNSPTLGLVECGLKALYSLFEGKELGPCLRFSA
jgi:CRISPR associated protein Cas1